MAGRFAGAETSGRIASWMRVAEGEPPARRRLLDHAVRLAGIAKPACHTLRLFFATHLLEDCYDIRTVQELLGHRDVTFGFTVYGFAIAYAALSAVDPSQFNRSLTGVRAVYFAITTAATVGYGDIHPVAALAQLLVSCQIVVCFLYALLLIAVAASGASKAKEDA